MTAKHYLILTLLVFLLLVIPIWAANGQSPIEPLQDVPAGEVYNFDTVFSFTGDPVKINILYTECVGPLAEDAMFDVSFYQWENRQLAWTGTVPLGTFYFTPPRVGHFYLQGTLVGDPTQTYDTRLGECNCIDPCLCPDLLRPWMVFAWPQGIVGEGTIE